jgi:branched-chain amino acid transport system ATP-binding protein
MTAAAGSAAVPAALELDSVDAAYGPYRALFGVSLSVPLGSVTALLGANGAGKSTVARVVSGLVPVTRGRVSISGREVTGEPPWKIARAGVAHVPEGRGIFTSLTVEENLVLAFRREVGRPERRAALARAFDTFPILAERRRQQAGSLSGGQQRILSLAKVLAVPPSLLVADELSFGLAPVIVDSVYEGLARVSEAGSSLLVVEQHLDRVLSIADHAVVLGKGRVVWSGQASGAAPAMEEILSAGQAEPQSPPVAETDRWSLPTSSS